MKSDPEQMLTHKITVAKTGNNEFSWKVQEGDLTTSNPGTETRSTKRIKKGGDLTTSNPGTGTGPKLKEKKWHKHETRQTKNHKKPGP